MVRLMPRPLSALSSKREVVRQFTPSWFTVTMSTGIVGLLIADFPYDAPAKSEVGWAFWWLTLALFCVFLLMFAARFAFFPRDAMRLFDEPFQAMFLGAIPPSLSVIVNGFPTFLAPRWGTQRVMEAAVVLWWCNAGLSMLCTTLLPFFMFVNQHADAYRLEAMTAGWLLPLIPCVVSAGSGGIIATAASLGSADEIIQMSYILWGIGVPLCFMVMTVYYRRLVMHKLPPKEVIVSSFLPVGPCGMGALALMTLGAATVRVYPPPAAGDVAVALGGASADPASAESLLHQVYAAWAAGVALTVGNIVALIMWGAGLWWLVVAVYSVGITARKMRFGMGWWGFVFPLGVFSSAANTLWQHLPGLAAMRPVAAVLICCTILLWCFVMSLTLVLGWNGSLFCAPCLHKMPAAAKQLSATAGGEEVPSSGNATNGGGGSDSSAQEGEGGGVGLDGAAANEHAHRRRQGSAALLDP